METEIWILILNIILAIIQIVGFVLTNKTLQTYIRRKINKHREVLLKV